MRFLLVSALALLIVACSTARADTPDPPATKYVTNNATPQNVYVIGSENRSGVPYLLIGWGSSGKPPDGIMLEIYDRNWRTRLTPENVNFNTSSMHLLSLKNMTFHSGTTKPNPNGDHYATGDPYALRTAGCQLSANYVMLDANCIARFQTTGAMKWTGYKGFPRNFIQFGMEYQVRVIFTNYSLERMPSAVHRVTIKRRQSLATPAPTPTPSFATQEHIPVATPTPLPTATPRPTPNPTPSPTSTPPQSSGTYRVHGLESITAAGLGTEIETWINQQSVNGYRLHSIVPVSRDRVLVVAVRR